MASPIEQFKIERLIPIKLGNVDISYTNSALWMTIAVVVVTLFLVLGTRQRALVPGRWQSMAEMSYEFVANLLQEQAGNAGRVFFPFIFTLFMFILAGNLLGLIPYSFTFTSHIVVTFGMAIVVFIGVTVIGFIKHGFHFLSFFVPKGVPAAMLILIIPIEILSYLTRPVSLAIRLFANMMAGHTMLKVFSGFVVALGVLGGWLPLAVNVALTGFEVLVAFLQAYVFAILTCIYLNDALHMDH
ncbi:F0F1 ATP synthase subunit A [Reyranella sp. CPCC 100927]|uniref:F0F1 ATP synthase subunit A n=1 Tax=Reyranella sp. CPCC 100927 TaxID=2599616 RepID=UPI0011B65467|nr:F0F1 ATP synthase subunit A [Reyranella sp. CPCC 100927]TWS97079.1 F0F1 ATP synthase subunit A [Reyranella sp. CPCC 100927]